MAGKQRAHLAAGEAADIVHAPVMRRQQPVIGRQIEDRDRARPEAAMRLFQGEDRLDPAMAEDVEREVGAERAAAQRHFVDRTRRHRPAGLGRGEGGRKGVVFQAQAWRGRPPRGPASAACRRCRSRHRAPGPAAGEPASARTRSCAASVRRPRYHHMRSSTACMRSYSARSTPCPLPPSVFFPPAYDIFAPPCQPSRPNPRSFRRASNGCCWCRCSPCRSCGWPATSSRRSITTSPRSSTSRRAGSAARSSMSRSSTRTCRSPSSCTPCRC